MHLSPERQQLELHIRLISLSYRDYNGATSPLPDCVTTYIFRTGNWIYRVPRVRRTKDAGRASRMRLLFKRTTDNIHGRKRKKEGK